jgi:hypothetical protein
MYNLEIFTKAWSKQSLTGRKFSQSGHSVLDVQALCDIYVLVNLSKDTDIEIYINM